MTFFKITYNLNSNLIIKYLAREFAFSYTCFCKNKHMDMLSPDRPRVSIGSMSPVTPPSTPVATPSPKAEREIRRSGKLLRQLKAVAGEGASTRHR